MKKYQDIISGLILLVFASLVYIGAKEVSVTGDQFITSATFPMGAACLLSLFAVILIVRNIVALRGKEAPLQTESSKTAEASVDEEDAVIVKEDPKGALISIVIIALYIVLLKQVGFIIMTVLFLFAQILVLAPRESRRSMIVRSVIISVVATVIIYLAFEKGLSLTLPHGILG